MTTLREALHSFLLVDRAPGTNVNYKRVLTNLITAIGPDRDVRRVTHDDLADYVAQLKAAKKLRASTLQDYVRMMKTFFNYCVGEKRLKYSPAQNLAVRGVKRRPGARAIPPHELKAMCEIWRHHPRNHAIMLFLADTGCRVGGAASLSLDTLNLAAEPGLGTAVLLEKGAREVEVWFGEETVAALARWLAVRPKVEHKFVFTTNGPSGKPLLTQGISDVVRKASVMGGASRVWGPHAIRHSVGHALARRGLPVTAVSRKLNHVNNGTTTDFYFPDSDDYMREVSRNHALAALSESQNLPPESATTTGAKIIRFPDARKKI